jgi:hypothetical protein
MDNDWGSLRFTKACLNALSSFSPAKYLMQVVYQTARGNEKVINKL